MDDQHPMADVELDGTTGLPKVDNRMRGFLGLNCLLCGEEGSVWIYLNDVTCFHCSECDDEFRPADVIRILEPWGPVLRWIASAPVLENRSLRP